MEEKNRTFDCKTSRISYILNESASVKTGLSDVCIESIHNFSKALKTKINNGCKVLLFGNGGSACDATHIAAEIVGRFQRERNPWPAISLASDPVIITAIANDYGFEQVFKRQVEALVKPGDLVVGLTTSGRSENVLLGLEAAKAKGAYCVALTGKDGLLYPKLAHIIIAVPSTITARIQECHITIGHIVCEIAEDELVKNWNRYY